MDAFGQGMVMPPALYATISNNAPMTATVDLLMDATAEDYETYTNLLRASQILTAQNQLGRYCAQCQQQLEQRQRCRR